MPEPAASESASPSPSQSLDPAAKRGQKAVEAATATLTDFLAAENRVAQNGYTGWETEVAPFWGSAEFGDEQLMLYKQRVQDHQRREGEVVAVSMEPVDYTPDADGKDADEVVIDMCGDITGITVYKGDEAVPPAEGVPDRFVTKYVLRYHPDEGVWAIQSGETGVEPRAC